MVPAVPTQHRAENPDCNVGVKWKEISSDFYSDAQGDFSPYHPG